MKWFSHRCDGRDQEFVDLVFEKFSHEGYSVWYQLREVLGVEIEKEVDAFRAGTRNYISPVMTVDVDWLSKRCRTTRERLLEFAAFCKKKGRVSLLWLSRRKDRICLEIPNLLEDSDEYFKKAIREICAERKLDPKKVLRLSGDTPESIRTHSGQSKAEVAKDSRPQEAEQTVEPAPEPGEDRGEEGTGEPSAASPLPPERPRAAPAAAAAAAVPPYLPEGAAPEVSLAKPHLFGVLLLLRHLKFTLSQAMDYGLRIPVREICGVAREAGAKDNPGGYARALLDRRLRRESPLSFDEARDVLVKVGEIDALWRTDRRPGESEESFVRRVGSGGIWKASLAGVRVEG